MDLRGMVNTPSLPIAPGFWLFSMTWKWHHHDLPGNVDAGIPVGTIFGVFEVQEVSQAMDGP